MGVIRSIVLRKLGRSRHVLDLLDAKGWGVGATGLDKQVPILLAGTVPVRIVGIGHGSINGGKAVELGAGFGWVNDASLFAFLRHELRNGVVGHEESRFVHVVDGHVDVGQVLGKVGNESSPKLQPGHTVGDVAMAGGGAIADFDDVVPGTGSLLGLFGIESPKGRQVLVYPVKVVFDDDGIDVHGSVEPHVKAGGRVTSSSLAILLRSRVEGEGPFGKEGIVTGLGIDHELSNRMLGSQLVDGFAGDLDLSIPKLDIVPERIAGEEEKGEEDEGDVAQGQARRPLAEAPALANLQQGHVGRRASGVWRLAIRVWCWALGMRRRTCAAGEREQGRDEDKHG